MSKDLNKMSNEELWRLFPIILADYNPEWKNFFLNEKNLLLQTLGDNNVIRINHIGSTAVEGLIAKPTIDILIEINQDTDLNKFIENMESIDYIYSFQPNKPSPQMMFMKGYTPEGFKGQSYHVHVRYFGDWNELYFRDYLIINKKIAEEYGKLKLKLKEKFQYNRDAYTEAKSEFVLRVTELARKEIIYK